MDLLALLAVLIGCTFVFTRAIYRRRTSEGFVPSDRQAIAGAFCASLFMVLIVYSPELFSRRFWEDSKGAGFILLPFFFCFCMAVTSVPALLLVRHCRKRK
jgi:hypothetical protein